MTAQKGRSLLLKLETATGPQVLTTIGAIRTTSMTINNNPVDATTVEDSGVQTMLGDAGVQTMSISVDGVFKDATVEETLRAAAFARTDKVFQILFPNGDDYEGTFCIQDYARGGSHDGLETFSMTLVRNGAGTYTAAA